MKILRGRSRVICISDAPRSYFQFMNWNRTTYALVISALVLSFSACGDTLIDPFENDEKYFTVYGFLDQEKMNNHSGS